MQISRKWFEIEAWYQLSTNRIWAYGKSTDDVIDDVT